MTEEPININQQNARQGHSCDSRSSERSIDESRESYGANFQEHLLEQYKMYVEMMDRVTERRGKTNVFYISLLSGILAFASLLAEKELLPGSKELLLLIIAIQGLLLCIVWMININSYKQLNRLKFKIIQEIEKSLPFPCYSREWLVKEPKTGEYSHKQYRRLTKVENYVPFILAIPYLGLIIYSIKNLIAPIN